MDKFVLAADLGGTNLRVASVSNNGEILHRVKFPIPRSKSRDDITEAIVQAIEACRDETDGIAVGAAVAVPGIVDAGNGIIFKAPNLPALDGADIGAAVSDRTGLHVVVENDANAAAVGEMWLGNGEGAENAIMVTLGTGVGGGLIINGRVVRGADGTAGEIGHINVEPEGVECGCGSHGCLEQYSSATAVARFGSAERHRLGGNGSSEVTAEEVFEAAEKGEEWAENVFRRQGYYLGLGLAGLVNCLNPEVIIIGGGGAGAWEYFSPALLNELKKRAYTEPAMRAKIKPSRLGDDAGLLGAARIGFAKAPSESDVSV